MVDREETASVPRAELDIANEQEGVDLTLVRYTLSLTPTERLKAVENFMNAMTTVRRLPPAADETSTASDDKA